MKQLFKIGDKKVINIQVKMEDAASFDTGNVHPVYATFSLGRDAEWCCRLFVLEMKEEDEEGIGTFLSIHHVSPALVGVEVRIVAEIIKLELNEIICSYQVFCGERLVAYGEQGQKILRKTKLEKIFSNLAG